MNMNVSRSSLGRLLTFVLALIAANAQGQGFSKLYPPASASAQALVQTADGGYFMAGEIPSTGQMFLQKTNAAGVATWSNHLSLDGTRAIAACNAADGGLVVLAENYPAPSGKKNLLLKLDAAGNLLWQHVIDNVNLPNGLRDMIPTADGNFLAAGEIRDNALNQDIRLVKLDQDGNILWSTQFGDPAANEVVASLVELPGGIVAIGGAGFKAGDRDLFLAKADPQGNLLWEKWYNKPATQLAYDLLYMSDGGLMLLGDTYGQDPIKISLLKTDTDGTEAFFVQYYPWTQLPANNDLYTIGAFTRDDADNIYIAGYGPYSGDPTTGFTTIIKMDGVGTPVWKKELPSNGQPWCIIRTTDNRFAMAGGTGLSDGAFLIKVTEEGDIYTNKIAGNVYQETGGNCTPDSGEPVPSSVVVTAQNQFGEIFIKPAAPDGSFLIPVSEGDFSVTAAVSNSVPGFWSLCDTPVVTVAGTYQTVQAGALGLEAAADCPLMYVEIATAFLRRCMANTYFVDYCNTGGATASNASVVLTLPGPDMQYNASSIPLGSQSGNELTFPIPDVAPGECGTFWVRLFVDCDAELGDLLCVEAHVYPDSVCPPPSSQWDRSRVEVSGDCDGAVRFTLQNTGSGDMSEEVEYVIVEDQIMYMQGTIQLESGQDTVIELQNPGGGPYFLQTAQTTGYPVASVPSAIVTPCGGAAQSSALQFPNDEAEPWLAVHCEEVIGSYDPNDKRGFPLGWQGEHFIERDQDLQYMIRFQNTGTDTAFLVVIRDTLSGLLDAASLRPGPSSHPYSWSVEGSGVLTFRFDNILLVDSFKNEPASHGFVTFGIAQQADLPLGSLIENRAGIYFDFNEAVLTNTYFHTVGKPFTTFTAGPGADNAKLEVWPNPFSDRALFRVVGVETGAIVQYMLTDVLGRTVRTGTFSGNEYLFQTNGIVPGLYFLHLEENGRLLASGKLRIAE